MTVSDDEQLMEYAETLIDKYAKGRLGDEKFNRLMTKLSEWAEYSEREVIE